jgi:glycosyltransferase involved in cell wall biosynthesis
MNSKLALPNKLFEYLQAGLPVVVNGPSEKENLVNAYSAGKSCPDGDAIELARALNAILADPPKMEGYRTMALRAALELNWENEELRLRDIYERIAPSGNSVDRRTAVEAK